MKYSYVFLILLICGQAMAQNYPELLVSPLASERIKREAQHEARTEWSTHVPVQISGLATLAAGITANGNLDKDKDSEGVGPKVAMLIGGSWVAATIWMQTSYRPYLHGYSDVKKMPYSNPREQLAAERMAEEHIDDTARLMRKVKWLSFGTNLIGSAYALSSAEKDTAGQAVSILGVAASFVPLLFPYRAEQVSEDQRTYKKKVFGPITFGNSLMFEPATRKAAPGVTATVVF